MRKVLISALIVLSQASSAGDFEDGIAAYNRKEYSTAFGIFERLSSSLDTKLDKDKYNTLHTYLGLMYKTGQGVSVNYRKAAALFQAAALSGNYLGQYYLGSMYLSGYGVPKDYVLAYMWINIAAREGIKEIEKDRDLLEKKMTQSQIGEAQRMSRECLKNMLKNCESFIP